MAVDYFLHRAGAPHLTTIEWERLRRDSRVPEEKVCGVLEEMAVRMRAYHPNEYAKVDAIMSKKYGRKFDGSGTMFGLPKV